MSEEEKKEITENDHPKQSLEEEAQALIEQQKRIAALEDENKQLKLAKTKFYDSVINGSKMQEDDDQSKSRSKKAIIDDMLKVVHNGGSNLEYVKLACELDDKVIEETGESVFLPVNSPEAPSSAEREGAKRTRELFDYALEEAKGDEETFNMILNRHIKPDPVKPKTSKKR